jgi:hypothetical protein
MSFSRSQLQSDVKTNSNYLYVKKLEAYSAYRGGRVAAIHGRSATTFVTFVTRDGWSPQFKHCQIHHGL